MAATYPECLKRDSQETNTRTLCRIVMQLSQIRLYNTVKTKAEQSLTKEVQWVIFEGGHPSRAKQHPTLKIWLFRISALNSYPFRTRDHVLHTMVSRAPKARVSKTCFLQNAKRFLPKTLKFQTFSNSKIHPVYDIKLLRKSHIPSIACGEREQ